LVITDILMPTMDGYEFVRQLRADAAVMHIPVIFCTAHYHEQEARNLARACGVASVLTKPCEPEAVLNAVQAALGLSPPPRSPSSTEEFDREHLRRLTDKLSEKADHLRRVNDRLNTLVELGLQLGSERDPQRLLQSFCQAARDVVGARYAVVGIVTGDGLHSGTCSPRHGRRDRRPPRPARPAGRPLRDRPRRVPLLRRQNPGGDPQAVGLPAAFPPVHSALAARSCRRPGLRLAMPAGQARGRRVLG